MNDCFICNKHAGTIETTGIMIYEDEVIELCNRLKTYLENNQYE